MSVVAALMRLDDLPDMLRRQLAVVCRRRGADLVSCRLNGGGFVDADVRGVGGNDGFPRPECGGDERQIGERAPSMK